MKSPRTSELVRKEDVPSSTHKEWNLTSPPAHKIIYKHRHERSATYDFSEESDDDIDRPEMEPKELEFGRDLETYQNSPSPFDHQ